MYEEHFGFDRSPFRITPDTSLFYTGGHRGDILGALIYAVHRGEGIIKVVGEVGSGKTMLCRMLQLELPDNVEIIYVANPSVSAEDILFVIADELKFSIARNASKHELVSRLQHYLLQKHGEGKQVVLFIEEAQGMPLETLEEIRLLSNLETDRHKLLQIILFGQPELDHNLAKKSIRQLRERITHDFQLAPLDADEVYQYLDFRMREVGYSGPALVSKKLANKMASYSEGLLRRINILADKMLLSAYADGTHNLTSKHLEDAVRDSGFSRLAGKTDTGRPWLWLSAGLGLLLVLAFVAWYGDESPSELASAEPLAGGQEQVQQNSLNRFVGQSAQSGENDLRSGSQAYIDSHNRLAETASDSALQQAESSSPVQEQNETQTQFSEITPAVKKTEKNQQSIAKLARVGENQSVAPLSLVNEPVEDQAWLDKKMEISKNWLSNADKRAVSIQVMARNKKAGKQLVDYLWQEWPMDIDKTYLFEVNLNAEVIYQVFYGEFPTITIGRGEMKQLPTSVKRNSPYLRPINLMQQALL